MPSSRMLLSVIDGSARCFARDAIAPTTCSSVSARLRAICSSVSIEYAICRHAVFSVATANPMAAAPISTSAANAIARRRATKPAIAVAPASNSAAIQDGSRSAVVA